MYILIIILTTIALGILWCSLFEWTLHRFVMHRPVHFLGVNITYPFEKHALTHHRTFTGEAHYHIQNEQSKEVIRMAWWAGPALVFLTEAPFLLIGVFFYLFSSILHASWLIPLLGILTSSLYFFSYEYFHWLMHDPKNRLFERTRVFRFINGHHVLHHKFDGNNLNVVFPFANWLFGTLLLRSHTTFQQPRGPAVPDVQPR
jgi:multisubunit Na+/H+ antiporter MnhG subunit